MKNLPVSHQELGQSGGFSHRSGQERALLFAGLNASSKTPYNRSHKWQCAAPRKDGTQQQGGSHEARELKNSVYETGSSIRESVVCNNLLLLSRPWNPFGFKSGTQPAHKRGAPPAPTTRDANGRMVQMHQRRLIQQNHDSVSMQKVGCKSLQSKRFQAPRRRPTARIPRRTAPQ